MPTFALNFSRHGGEIVCQYYNFLRLGREGYRRIQQACYDNAKTLADAIEQPWGVSSIKPKDFRRCRATQSKAKSPSVP